MKNNYYKVTLLILLLLAITFSANAQLRYKADYRFLMDNLEGSDPYVATRTIAGMSLTPLVGVQFGNHSFLAGAHLLTEFGTKKDLDKAEFRAYYEYKDSKFKALAGVFSAYETESYPLSFFTTAAPFLGDAIHGLYGKYKDTNGWIEAYIDWFKSDRKNSVDRFSAVISGERRWGGFFVKGLLGYNHFADQPVFETFTVLDHAQYDLKVGYDFARHQNVFKVLRISAGVMGDMNRKRDEADKGMEFGMGFQSEQFIQWKGFILFNTIYTGQPQMLYYKEYPFVYTGSPFYQADFQDMLIAKYEYKYKWLKLSAALAFYFTPETIANQQIISISFSLDDVIKFGKKL